MDVKVVFVEPLYQQNLGYGARVMKNFGVGEMRLVRPRCDYKGKDAIKYSKHAVDLIKNARVYKSVREATRDCDIVVGTTGQWFRTEGAYYNVYPSGKLKSIIGNKKAALLIGRDDLGLTKEEMRGCDATVFVETNKEYPVLNISHALAILLYELNGNRKELPSHIYSEKKGREGLIRLFENSIKGRQDIRDKKSVAMAFRHVINRAEPTNKEINALSVGFKRDQKRKF